MSLCAIAVYSHYATKLQMQGIAVGSAYATRSAVYSHYALFALVRVEK